MPISTSYQHKDNICNQLCWLRPTCLWTEEGQCFLITLIFEGLSLHSLMSTDALWSLYEPFALRRYLNFHKITCFSCCWLESFLLPNIMIQFYACVEILNKFVFIVLEVVYMMVFSPLESTPMLIAWGSGLSFFESLPKKRTHLIMSFERIVMSLLFFNFF